MCADGAPDRSPDSEDARVTVAAILRAGLVGFMVGAFGLWLHALLASA